MSKLIIFLLFLNCALVYAIPPIQKTVSNEDIRDAILSLVHMVRSIDDKLERHEFRDKHADEYFKKQFSSLDKRFKALEPMRGAISRLDERLANVETILMQNDKREAEQIQKIVNVVDALINSVDSLKSDVEKVGNLGAIENVLNVVSENSKRTRDEIDQLKKQNAAFMENVLKGTENFDRVKKQLGTSELLLAKYENKLTEFNSKIATDVVTLDYKEQKDWQSSFLNALEKQQQNISDITKKLTTVEQITKNLPTKEFIEKFENNTLDLLEEIKSDNAESDGRQTQLIENKMKDVMNDIDKKHDEYIKGVTDLTEIIEGLTESLSNSYDQLKKDVAGLAKIEKVMIQAADGVMDTKRRVEYGVHQILLEVGNIVKEHAEKINNTIYDRFDMFEQSVLDSENGALANLTSKIGEEIDQVWRQIGIMHQQMGASTDTLNKLQNQTDVYVSGSLNVMDSMKGKVGQITTRMSEVEENLNHLMGRLSLVTQEFNRIKSGLGKALDEIRASFIAVQSKVKDVGPGPHKIASDEIIDDDVPAP